MKKITKQQQIAILENPTNINNQKDLKLELVKKQIKEYKNLSYIFPLYSIEIKICSSKILEIILNHLKISEHFSSVEYCIREIMANAYKANLKKIYFDENNADLENSEDYQKTIVGFYQNIFASEKDYQKKSKKSGYFLALCFQLTEKNLIIEIINNRKICDTEKNRIDKLLDVALKLKSPTEILENSFNNTEGSGIGIILTVQMLAKLQAEKPFLYYKISDNTTIFGFNINCNLLLNSQTPGLK